MIVFFSCCMHAFSVFVSMHAHEGYSYVRWWKIYFPVCHSCGPPKGLKLTERGGEGRETQWWYHTPAERCSRKNFKVVFSSLKKKQTKNFDLTLFFVWMQQRRKLKKKKEKIHIHSQLSNCRCVLSYKCLCSYLCYLYPCMRLWTQTHTCQLIHLPAIQRAALCVFQVSLSSLILLKIKIEHCVVEHVVVFYF